MHVSQTDILAAGRNCWRVAAADRAALLVDGAAYFGALRQSLLAAERTVFVVGWDVDSRTRIVGPEGEPDDGAPAELGALLSYLVQRKPGLMVHVLLWDYSVIYALEREPLPSLSLDWATPKQVKVCLDDVLPLGASHHQKIVVVDDAVAFCGGLDLTIRRWDTPDHAADTAARVDPGGNPYRPFHDMQMLVDGDAAAALAELIRERWHDAACERPPDIEPAGDPWPSGVTPDVENATVGIARTLPSLDGRDDIREVEQLYLDAIDAAQRAIYVENQFLTADKVARHLAQRLRDRPDLEAVLVSPKRHESWLETHSMEAGRIRFQQRLADAGVDDRARLLYPVVPDGDGEQDVMMHAKLMIVDDRLLRIGSSNLNNRSMGVDTECDLAVEAATDDQRAAIAGLRDRLLAEHLGCDADTVARTIAENGSLTGAVDALSQGRRTLRPIEPVASPYKPISDAVGGLADPERPVEAERFVGDMFGGQPGRPPINRLLALALTAAAFIALALAWRYTPLSQLADLDTLEPWFERLRASAWTPLLLPALYVAASLVVFPITLLILLTAIAFDIWSSLAYAIGGALLASIVTYQLGALIGRSILRDAMGRRVNRISRALARRGIVSVVTIRLIPIAPFSLINVVAGASHIGFRDFVLGTLLGMAPGIVVMTVMGQQLGALLRDPSLTEVGLLVLAVAAWLGVTLALQALVKRLRADKDG